jgi:hypothetical protein
MSYSLKDSAVLEELADFFYDFLCRGARIHTQIKDFLSLASPPS